jgi:hypothetical protein
VAGRTILASTATSTSVTISSTPAIAEPKPKSSSWLTCVTMICERSASLGLPSSAGVM